MEREIKFRGKDYEWDWVYGDLIHVHHDRDIVMIQNERGHGSDVDIETVGQFTGLYDKNGKEIYEGDILKLHEKEIYAEVFWYEKLAAFFVKMKKANSLGVSYTTGNDTLANIVESKEYEIVGNIHDNPTLLKGGDNGRI